jgi:hypothetical protein
LDLTDHVAAHESADDVVDGARSRQRSPRVIVANESHQGAIHMQIATIGLDIAKNGVGSLRRSQRPESGVKADMPRQLNRPVSPRF